MNEFDLKAKDWDLDPAKMARAERVAEAILEMGGDLSACHGLEVGCGTGLLGLTLKPHVARMTLSDTSEGMLAILREKIAAHGLAGLDVLAHDFTQGPLPETRYDLICSLMTLHHIPDTEGALRRFHSLLAPGGRVFLADLDSEDGSFHGQDVDVHRGFDRETLGRQLGESGFQEIRFTTPFVIERDTAPGGRRFPVFLVAGRRG